MHSLMNFLTLAMLLGTFRDTQTCLNSLKVPVLVIKALGEILAYFLENLGYFFTKPSLTDLVLWELE